MIEEHAIWTEAGYLVAKHGAAAPIVAERFALDCGQALRARLRPSASRSTAAERFALSNGEHNLDEERAQWLRVARATLALLRACPGEGEQIH